MTRFINSILLPVINLVVYGNFWIGLAAAGLFAQTSFLFNDISYKGTSTYFFFFATAFLYSIHRTYGITKVRKEHALERFEVIYTFRKHIYLYGLLFFLGTLYHYWLLPARARLYLLIPGFVALGYVLPLPLLKKRLRDIPLIKIFLIAIIWSWTVSFYPAILSTTLTTRSQIWFLFFEKFFFLLAITIPFDIRDIAVDREVPTIPLRFGVPKARILSLFSWMVSLALVFYNGISWYPDFLFKSLLYSYFFTLLALIITFFKTNDLYYMGVLDGTMVVKGLLALIFMP